MLITRQRKGFTLIEMLLVLIIIAVLAVVVIPRIMNSRKRALDEATRQTLVELNRSVEYFEADIGCYPTDIDALIANPGENYVGKRASGDEVGDITIPDSNLLWRGPYLKNAVHPLVAADSQASWTILADSTSTLGIVKIVGTTSKASDGTYYTNW